MVADRIALAIDVAISGAAGLAMWAILAHVAAAPGHPLIYIAISTPVGMGLRWAMAEVFA